MAEIAPAPIKYKYVLVSSSGNNTMIEAVSGKRFRVIAMKLMAASAVNAIIQSGAGGTALDGGYPAANGGYVLPANPYGWFETLADNTLLNLNLSGAVSVIGCIVYQEIS